MNIDKQDEAISAANRAWNAVAELNVLLIELGKTPMEATESHLFSLCDKLEADLSYEVNG